MSRHRTLARRCSTEGCRETDLIVCTSRDDIKRVSEPWACRMHDKPGEYLSPTNRETTAVLALHPRYVSGSLAGYSWGPEDAEKGSHPIVSGPGFWAEAKNFPPGTRLIVTARIELPDEEA